MGNRKPLCACEGWFYIGLPMYPWICHVWQPLTWKHGSIAFFWKIDKGTISYVVLCNLYFAYITGDTCVIMIWFVTQF